MRPGLAVMLAGDDPGLAGLRAQQGARLRGNRLRSAAVRAIPRPSTQAELLGRIEQLNADPAVHGILVQLPLPKHIDATRVLEAVVAGEGRRRLPPGEPRRAAGRPPAARALHARRRACG